MNSASDILTKTALGAAGGMAGTMAIRELMTTTQQDVPSAVPPIREDPGEFLVDWAEEKFPDSARHYIPEGADKAAAGALAMGYGLAFGAAYGLLRPRGGNPIVEGLALGAACWAAGYLGWLPALGLMRPVTRQTPAQVAGPLMEHLVYGMATVAVFDLLRECVDSRFSSEA
jgi:hypothetical protein